MAKPLVIWAESFDHYLDDETFLTQGLWAQFTGTLLTTNGARTGDRYASISNSGQMRRVVGTRVLGGIAFGLRFPSLPTTAGSNRLSVRTQANNNICTIVFMPDGSLWAHSGGHTGTVLYASDAVLSAGTWHHVEVVTQISTTVGSIEVRVDSIPVISITDLNLGSDPLSQYAWVTESITGVATHIDDIVAHDAGDEQFVGQARVGSFYAVSDSTPFEWAITGAGSGAEAVDEVPPDDDTSYITALNQGDIATFTLPELPADVVDIIGIFVPVRARQDQAGTTQLQAKMLSGAGEEDGGTAQLTTAYQYTDSFVFNRDPALSPEGPWTKETFEAGLLQLIRTE